MFPRWQCPQTCQSADDISVHTNIIKIQPWTRGQENNDFENSSLRNNDFILKSYFSFYLILKSVSLDAINSLGTSAARMDCLLFVHCPVFKSKTCGWVKKINQLACPVLLCYIVTPNLKTMWNKNTTQNKLLVLA